MDEAYKSKYYVHPGADNMYYDLRDRYWWPRMKKDITVYVSRCLTCLKIKAEHQRPSSLLQQPEIPEWKWKWIVMDFVTKLPRTSSRHDIQFWVIARYVPISIISDPVVRLTSRFWRVESCKMHLGTRLGHEYRLKVARDRQKSYANKRRKHLEFSVGDYVLLKVSPWKGVVRFGKKRKLVPRFVGPFEIIEKCLADPTLQMPLDEIQVDAKLNFVEELVEILEREFKKLKRSRIAIVKVRWNSKRGPEFTWEREDQMKLKYPHLFSASSS
ncbi:putative reverse transcriptase domain-containing protein [Tanacetum coccineum]